MHASKQCELQIKRFETQIRYGCLTKDKVNNKRKH